MKEQPQRLSGWNWTIAAISSILFVALMIGFALYRQTPPPAQPESAAPAEFSSGRAMQHLKIIAQKPHSIGTPAAEEVRQYLVKELNGMGASPVVQTASVVVQKDSKFTSGATVNNIVARLKGEGGSKAVLLMSHYDSAPTSPGASDDGSAVVTMLETLRALKSGPALKNDVIFLFTDGEEVGLLGAKAFVGENPLAKDVGLVLNFEARGVSGPAIMFETSAGNEWLIQEFAKAAPHPVANSLTYEIYKHMPNDTDLTVLKKAGYAGFNFAYINGVNRYHSRLDNIEHLDERSLQHQGSYALALTRHFGNLSLEQGPGNDATYFSVLSLFLVHYSTTLSIILAVVAALAFIGLIILGLKKKTLTVARMLWGLLAVSLSVIGSFVLVTVLVIVTFNKWQNGNNGLVLFVSFIALTVGVTSTMLILFRNKAGMQGLLIGGLSWWLLFMVVTMLLLPGGTYLFTWPLLFGVIGAGLILMTKDSAALTPKSFALYSLCAIPGLLLLAPLLYLLYTGIGLGVAGALMLLVVLLAALLIPHLHLITLQKKWLLPLISFAVCLVLLVIGIFSAGFNQDYPKTDSLFYVMNANAEKAIWASSDVKPDEWTAQFLSAQAEKGSLADYIPSNNLPILKAQAPLVSLAAPEIVLLDERTENQMRTLRLRVTTPRRAPLVSIYVDSKEGILDVAVNGKRVAGEDARNPPKYDNPWVLNYWAIPAEGIELTVSVKPSQALNINVVDSSYDLPQVPGKSLAGRPGHLMPAQFGYTDSTLVSKSVTF